MEWRKYGIVGGDRGYDNSTRTRRRGKRQKASECAIIVFGGAAPPLRYVAQGPLIAKVTGQHLPTQCGL